MAYDYFNLDEEQKKAQQAQQPGGEKTLSGESGVITGNAPQNNAQGQSSSGSFANLNSYLDANKDSGLGSRLAGDVGTQTENAVKQQDVAKQNVTGLIDKNTVSQNQDFLNNAFADPNKVNADAASKKQFSGYLNAKYEGPTQFAETNDYSTTNSLTNKAASDAKSAGDATERKTVLDSMYGTGAGRGGYNAGQQQLDNLLIQQDPNAPKDLTAQYQKAQEAQKKFTDLNSYLGQYATKAATTTADTRKQTRDQLGINAEGNLSGGGQIGQTSNVIDERLKDYTRSKETAGLNLKNYRWTKGQPLDEASLSATGLKRGEHLWGLNLADYLQENDAPTKSSVATKDEASRLTALQALGGKENSLIDTSKAGSYDPNNPFSYDTDLLRRQMAPREAEYNDFMNTKVNGNVFYQTPEIMNNNTMSDVQKYQKLQELGLFTPPRSSGNVYQSAKYGSINDMYNETNDPDNWTLKSKSGYYRPGNEAWGKQQQAQINPIAKLMKNMKNYYDVVK